MPCPAWQPNLTAMLDDRYAGSDVDRSSDRKDTPLEEAVAPHGARDA